MTLIFNEEVSSKSIFELIEKIETSKEKDITLQITSNGGNIKCLAAFKDYIIQNDINFNTITCGFVASAATALFMLGKKRAMLPNSYIVLHEPTVSFDSKVNFDFYDLKEQLDYMELIRDIVFKELLEKTTITKSYLKKKIFKKDWTIGYSEAAKLGITCK